MHLGIDLGTSSVKAVLADGKNLFRDREQYDGEHSLMHHPVSMVEEAVIRLVQRLISQNGASVSGLAIGGHGPSLVFVDRQGAALTSIMTWQDKRASREAACLRELWEDFSRDATSYEAKVLWYHRHREELFAPGHTVLYPKDYLVMKLTGRRIMDHSTASTIRFREDGQNRWTDRGLGFDTGIFPEVIASTAEAGPTGTAFSRSCGLEDGIPVYAGGIDAYCESLGAGAGEPGDLVDGTGTSTCLSVCTAEEDGGDRHVLPGRRLAMRTISYTGGSVRWMKQQLGGMKELQEHSGPIPGPSGLVFLPYLTGERSPIWDEAARGVFFGLHSTTTARDMALAVLEGVAHAVRQNLETLDVPDDRPVRAVGGGAASGHWLQIKADVTGRTYWQMDQTDAAALGAAMISALGSGQWTREELLQTWTRPAREYHPRPRYREAYGALYRIYTGLYPQLRESYHQLQELYSKSEQLPENREDEKCAD